MHFFMFDKDNRCKKGGQVVEMDEKGPEKGRWKWFVCWVRNWKIENYVYHLKNG